VRGRLSRLVPKPSVVLPAIAIFFAIGGIGYAAATVGTNDIKNGAVTTKKLHKKAVTRKKVHKNAVTSPKVKDHSLKCRDMRFNCPVGATGATGPQGATGPAGGGLAGTGVNKVFYAIDGDAPTETVFSDGGLVLTNSCSGGNQNPVLHTTVDNANLHYAQGTNSYDEEEEDDFDVGETIPLGSDSNIVQINYATPGGGVTVAWLSLEEDLNDGPGTTDCYIGGFTAFA
jgi:hypothetical protein